MRRLLFVWFLVLIAGTLLAQYIPAPPKNIDGKPLYGCGPVKLDIASWTPNVVAPGAVVTIHGCFMQPPFKFELTDNRDGKTYLMQQVSVTPDTAKLVFPAGVPPSEQVAILQALNVKRGVK